MAQVTLKGNPVNTIGNLPAVGTKAPDFVLVKTDLSEVKLSDFLGKKVVLNIFPSLDTSTCGFSVRQFNQRASDLDNTVILCISMDLPFAHARFCETEGIENVINLSCYRNEGLFQSNYGVKILDGPLMGLNARSVVVLDEKGIVKYAQFAPEISVEPDYDAALAAL